MDENKITERNLNFRFNAVTHGILKESISEYEKVDYRAIYAQLEDQFKPSNVVEQILLERIVLSYIKLYRISRAEKEIMQRFLYPDYPALDPINSKAYKPKINELEILKLETYSRYETSAENRMYKAIAALTHLQKGDPAKQN